MFYRSLKNNMKNLLIEVLYCKNNYESIKQTVLEADEWWAFCQSENPYYPLSFVILLAPVQQPPWLIPNLPLPIILFLAMQDYYHKMRRTNNIFFAFVYIVESGHIAISCSAKTPQPQLNATNSSILNVSQTLFRP